MLQEETQNTRLEQLKALREVLARAIDGCKSMMALPSLSKQYRETIAEIEEIEGVETNDDISELLSRREADGKSNAVR